MSLLGSIVGGIANLVTGGAAGVIYGAAKGIIGSSKPKVTTPKVVAPIGTGMPQILRLPSYTPAPLMPAVIPDSTKVSGVSLGGSGGVVVGTTTQYFGGVTGSGSSTAMTRHKKIRRMNPANTKALRKAIRRVTAFQKLARQVGFSRPPAKLRGVHVAKRRS